MLQVNKTPEQKEAEYRRLRMKLILKAYKWWRSGYCKHWFREQFKYLDTPRIDRNVLARLPGADPTLRGQYIALGAHADHLGLARAAVDHDSVRAAHLGARSGAEGAASRRQTTEDDEYDRIKVITDSLHALRPIRRDSVNNGADDGGDRKSTRLNSSH